MDLRVELKFPGVRARRFLFRNLGRRYHFGGGEKGSLKGSIKVFERPTLLNDPGMLDGPPHQQATGEYPESGTSPQGQVPLYPQNHARRELLSYEQLPSGLASNGPPIPGISYLSQELTPYLTIGFPLSNLTLCCCG